MRGQESNGKGVRLYSRGNELVYRLKELGDKTGLCFRKLTSVK